MWFELLVEVEVEVEVGRGCVRLGNGVVAVLLLFGFGVCGWGGLTAEAILGVRGARLMPLTAPALREGICGRALAVVALVVWVSWPMFLFSFTMVGDTRATFWSRSFIRGVRRAAAAAAAAAATGGGGSGRGRGCRRGRGLVTGVVDFVAVAALALLADSRDADDVGGDGDVLFAEGFVVCGSGGTAVGTVSGGVSGVLAGGDSSGVVVPLRVPLLVLPLL